MQDILDEILDVESRTKNAIKFRPGATVLDYLIVLILGFGFVFVFGEKASETEIRLSGPLSLVPLVFAILYMVIPEWLFGATLGKKIMGLKVISLSGNRLTFGQIIKRRLGDIIDIWISVGIVGFVLMRKTPLHQRLGDSWSKTIVILQNNDRS